MTATVAFGICITDEELTKLTSADRSWVDDHGDDVLVVAWQDQIVLAVEGTVIKLGVKPQEFRTISAKIGYPSSFKNRAIVEALDILGRDEFGHWLVWDAP